MNTRVTYIAADTYDRWNTFHAKAPQASLMCATCTAFADSTDNNVQYRLLDYVSAGEEQSLRFMRMAERTYPFYRSEAYA
jgi:hypothetical protein